MPKWVKRSLSRQPPSGPSTACRRIQPGAEYSLPQNGAVVTLLSVCGSTHRESYIDIVMAAIVGPIIALAVVIVLGSFVGSF